MFVLSHKFKWTIEIFEEKTRVVREKTENNCIETYEENDINKNLFGKN